MHPIARFRPLLDAITDPAWLTDPEGALLTGNPPFERLLGLDVTLGDPYAALDLTREQARFVHQQGLATLAAEEALVAEAWLTDMVSGAPRLFQTTSTWLRDAEGVTVGMLRIAHDITGLKQVELGQRDRRTPHQQLGERIEELVADRTSALKAANDRLAERVERLELATSAAGIGVWEYRIGADRLIWDAQMFALYGIRPEDFEGVAVSWLDRVHPDDQARVFAEAIPTRCGEHDYETSFRVLWPDGSVHALSTCAQVTRDAAGVTQRVVGASWDITALTQTQVELERARDIAEAASRAKSTFLANMSHELRTPLNTILGRAELLRQQVYGPLDEAQQVALSSIEESGAHLLALINDVLDLSKVEATQLQLALAPVEVAELCRAAIRMVSQSAQSKQLALDWDIVGQAGLICADGRRLKQILVNLLANAVKFTPSGGRVGLSVRCDRARETISFTVWDSGIGIAPEDLGRLFQPFAQIESGLVQQHTGTGLGLALVRRLTELHGGGVSVESEPGAGSRFCVTLPWDALTEADLPAVTPPQPTPGAHPREASHQLALIVEDDGPNLKTLHDALLAAGYQVAEATDGAAAVALAAALSPAIIVMDVRLPVLDGLEALRRIRATPGLGATPIIALTALAMPGDDERCLEAGADVYLAKPVPFHVLFDTIAAQLQGDRADG